MDFLLAISNGDPVRRDCFREGWYWWFNEDGLLVAGNFPEIEETYGKGVSVNLENMRAKDWVRLKKKDPLVEWAEGRSADSAKAFLVYTARTAPGWFRELAKGLDWNVPKD